MGLFFSTTLELWKALWKERRCFLHFCREFRWLWYRLGSRLLNFWMTSAAEPWEEVSLNGCHVVNISGSNRVAGFGQAGSRAYVTPNAHREKFLGKIESGVGRPRSTGRKRWVWVAWYIFFHPFTFNLHVSLHLAWVSCRSHTVGSCVLIHSDNLFF